MLEWNRNRNTREHKLNVTTVLQLQIFCELMHTSARACVRAYTTPHHTQALRIGKRCFDAKMLYSVRNAMINSKLIDFCRPCTIAVIPPFGKRYASHLKSFNFFSIFIDMTIKAVRVLFLWTNSPISHTHSDVAWPGFWRFAIWVLCTCTLRKCAINKCISKREEPICLSLWIQFENSHCPRHIS